MIATLKKRAALQEVRDWERYATTIEKENLSVQGRAALSRLRSKVYEMQGVIEQFRHVKPFSPKEQGLKIVADLQTVEGGAFRGAELKAKWGLTPAVLHRRRKERRIVYWRNSRHDFFYPRWQFTEAGALLPGVQDILRIFQSDDEWRIMRYFLSPRRQLGERRPLDLLRDGEVDAVVEHARLHGAENTW